MEATALTSWTALVAQLDQAIRNLRTASFERLPERDPDDAQAGPGPADGGGAEAGSAKKEKERWGGQAGVFHGSKRSRFRVPALRQRTDVNFP